MKSIFTLLFILFFTCTFAQSNDEPYPKDSLIAVNSIKVHELRLGAIKLMTGGFLDVSYEYVNTANTGLGASLYINFDDSFYNDQFGILPYYRYYFGRNDEFKGRGFFVEGFAYAYQGKNELIDDEGVVLEQENFLDIAPGISLGSKWVNPSGFVFQLKLGVGRNILGNNIEYDAMLTGDFYFGYRF